MPVLHSILIDDKLHVAGYVQDADPGAVGAGMAWVDTSNGVGDYELKIRNAADDGWRTGHFEQLKVDYIDFDLTPNLPAHQEGRLHWDEDNGTLSLGMPGGVVELQIGQEHQIRCRNESGSTILNGQAVYQTGSLGNKPLIDLAKADSLATAFSFGVATEDIDHNSNGYVTKIGIVNEINTGVWPAATPLYLSDATAGALTPTPPTAPSISMFIGVVVDPGASGSISVNPTIVPRMQSLSSNFGTPSSDGEFYAWDTGDSRFELLDISDYVPRSEWLENGFDDASDTALAWDDGTRTLTLSPAVTSFDYHYAGYKYTESGNLSAQITDTEGLWVFYIGSGGAASLSTIHNPSYSQVEDAILNQCIVAYVYWDATNNDGRLMDERHGSILGRGAHHYLHEIFGSQYLSGMTLGDITADQNGNTDSHAQFSITAGRFYDEDIEHDTLAHASTDTWEYYYVDGSGDVRWGDCEATFPVYAIGGVIAYNNAGVLTAVPSNKYCLYHVFSTNIHTDAGGAYYPIVTPGIAVYNSKADAQDGALTELQNIDFGDWPVEEVIPVATVIYHHGAAMSNGVEAAIQSTEGGGDFVDWRFTVISGSSTSVNDHGALSGLTDDDHPLYLPLTAGSSRQITGDLYLEWTRKLKVDVGVGETPTNAVGGGSFGVQFGEVGSDEYHLSDKSYFEGDIILDSENLTIWESASVTAHELRATGNVLLAQQGGTVLVGTTTDAGNLQVYDGTLSIFESALQHSFPAAAGDVELFLANAGDLVLGAASVAADLILVNGDLYLNDGIGYFERDLTGTISSKQSAMQLGLAGTATYAAGAGASLLFHCHDDAGNKEYQGRISGWWENAGNGTEAGGVEVSVRNNAADTFASTMAGRFIPGPYFICPCPSTAPADADLPNNFAAIWFNTSGNTVEIKQKDNSGTVRSGTVATVT